MSLRRLAQEARDSWEVPRDLLLGRYPEFVTGGPLPRGDIPVFVFHSLEPGSFESQLRYLAENDYATLGASEYFDVLVGARPAPPRAVVLTFDDGRGSLWSIGQPLLKRYAMRGIVFLVPGRIRARRGAQLPTWADVEAGRASASEVLGREAGEGAFLSWEEVAALASSGLFEFESHTLWHARIHVGPQLAGFVTPGSRRGYAAMDLPLIRESGEDLLGDDVPLGTPILRSAVRTAEELRFFEDPGLRRGCIDLVAEQGGEAFFTGPGWRDRLERLLSRERITGRTETAAEREEALVQELAGSQRLIESHTGRAVTHLCYPWHVFGPTARRLAKQCGYRTAFCGKVAGVPITRPGGDPLAIARIGEDYVQLLPGRGRASLASVLSRKWRRRVSGRK